MKRLCTLALIAFAMCGTMNAEIVETYNAPTNFQAINTGENTIFWFTAPAEGGIVWNSTFSYDNGLGDMRQLGDGDTWANAGNGSEASTSAAVGAVFTNHASTLATPAIALEGGNLYEISFKSAGSRASNNQKLSVALYKDDQPVQTIIEASELSPSLSYQAQSATFSAPESGEYEIRFVFIESEKNCGASLRDIVLTSPIPEGRGALLGYNLYRNDEKVRYYEAAEAVQNQLYLELTDDTVYDYSTTYTFALQAVYEGGESPLSASSSFTTKEDPLLGIHTLLQQQPTQSYDLFGRRSTHAQGISIFDGKKHIR